MAGASKISESLIHVAMRIFLKKNGWLLIAGEYPNGSDDELNVLSITDPTIAKDNSPKPRQHSIGEFVPDLLAFRGNDILVIEAKPNYSEADKAKLINLINNNRGRLISSLKKFSLGKKQFSCIDYDTVSFIPTLAFGNPTFVLYPESTSGIFHLYVKDINNCKLVDPSKK